MIWELQGSNIFHFRPKSWIQSIKHEMASVKTNIKYIWVVDHLEEAYCMATQLYFTSIPELVKILDSKHFWMHSLFKSCCLQMCIKDHFVCRIPSTSETSVKQSCETMSNTSFTLSRLPKYFISPCTNAIQCTMLYYINFIKYWSWRCI